MAFAPNYLGYTMPRNCFHNDKISCAHNFLNHHKQNQSRYDELMAMPQSSLIVGSEFRRIELNAHQFLIVLFDHNDKEIAFHATGTILDDVIFNDKPALQLWVWKCAKPKHKPMIADLSEQILLEYLIERFHIIASDIHANLQGRNFWNEIASIILDKTLYVYRYNRNTKSIQEIANHEELVTNRLDIWGEGSDFSDILLVLTNDEVHIR